MRNGIYPTIKTLLLFTIPLLLIICSFWIQFVSYIGLSLNLFLIIIIFFDLYLSPGYKNLEIKVEFEKYIKLNKYTNFTLTVNNKNKIPAKLYILLDLDISFNRNYSKKLIKIPPLQKTEIKLKIFANRRGFYESKNFFIKGISLFGLLNIYRKFEHSLKINVVPTTFSKSDSFRFLQKIIKKYEGKQKNKLYGDGKDFEMLRDYIKGDEFGKIDWKITAKRRKPVTRIYKLENNFELSILIDCGRMMSTEIKGLSLLDYAVNASIILSFAAIKGNDSVSFTAFGSNIIKHISSSKNIKIIKKLNYTLTDLQYEFAESDYHLAFSFIKSKLSKRSLVILFTDIIDDSNIKIYHKYLSMLKKKHIMLLVLLKDKNLFNIAESIPGKYNSIYTKAAAVDLILRRNKTIYNLKRLGIEVLDLFPEEVTTTTLNKYLSIKHRN